MKIGELSARTGCPVARIRFYEQKGVLKAPVRTPGGQREYGQDAVRRLDFIMTCRTNGMSASSGFCSLQTIHRWVPTGFLSGSTSISRTSSRLEASLIALKRISRRSEDAFPDRAARTVPTKGTCIFSSGEARGKFLAKSALNGLRDGGLSLKRSQTGRICRV